MYQLTSSRLWHLCSKHGFPSALAGQSQNFSLTLDFWLLESLRSRLTKKTCVPVMELKFLRRH